MRRYLTLICCTLLTASMFSLAAPVALAAQDAPPPPAVLDILTERIKPGHNAAHLATEAAWPRAFSMANIEVGWLGMVRITGPSEVWFVSGYPSLAAMEAVDNAIDAAPGLGTELDRLWSADGEHVDGTGRMFAKYRPDLSNHTDVLIPTMRYFQIITFRIRPGKEAVFAEAAQSYLEVVKKAGVQAQAPWATYEVVAGMPGPTFMVWIPFKSMADMDDSSPVSMAMGKAMTAEVLKKFSTMASESYISVQTNYLRFSPRLSHLDAAFTDGDPSFWKTTP